LAGSIGGNVLDATGDQSDTIPTIARGYSKATKVEDDQQQRKKKGNDNASKWQLKWIEGCPTWSELTDFHKPPVCFS
jgi:hypothetical protein